MIALLIALLASFGAPPAAAGTTVYRCIGAHGEMMFSGRPCSETSDIARLDSDASGIDNTGHRAWLGRCAPSANALRDRVAVAFNNEDVNSLGALFLWRGFGTHAAYRRMRQLRELVHQPLAGLDLDGPPEWQAASGGYGALPTYAPTWLSISTADDPDLGTHQMPTEHRYALVQRDACVWLSF